MASVEKWSYINIIFFLHHISLFMKKQIILYTKDICNNSRTTALTLFLTFGNDLWCFRSFLFYSTYVINIPPESTFTCSQSINHFVTMIVHTAISLCWSVLYTSFACLSLKRDPSSVVLLEVSSNFPYLSWLTNVRLSEARSFELASWYRRPLEGERHVTNGRLPTLVS